MRSEVLDKLPSSGQLQRVNSHPIRATSLAAQLAKIAAKLTNFLILKAQKAAYRQSLIFELSIALTQDFDSLCTLCAKD